MKWNVIMHVQILIYIYAFNTCKLVLCEQIINGGFLLIVFVALYQHFKEATLRSKQAQMLWHAVKGCGRNYRIRALNLHVLTWSRQGSQSWSKNVKLTSHIIRGQVQNNIVCWTETASQCFRWYFWNWSILMVQKWKMLLDLKGPLLEK